MTRRRLTRCSLLALLIFAALPAAASANPIDLAGKTHTAKRKVTLKPARKKR